GHGACAEQNDEGRHARKCTYRLKVGAVTGKLALNLIYSTKPRTAQKLGFNVNELLWVKQ
ncbi:hypothetical protein Q2V34_25110, partial [Escherichia coli]|nr:hypothetical protein [Escherichia coli]